MNEEYYREIVKLSALNALMKALKEEYLKTEADIQKHLSEQPGNQIVAFISEHYPKDSTNLDLDRKRLVALVSERFNMPIGIADQLISHYTT